LAIFSSTSLSLCIIQLTLLCCMWQAKDGHVRISVITRGAEPFFRSSQLCSYCPTSQHIMELEDSLPCSQEPSTGPYSEPDWSNPSYLKWILIVIQLHLGLHSGLLPRGFNTNVLYAFLCAPIHGTCRGHRILLDLSVLIILGEECKLRSFSIIYFSATPPSLTSLWSEYSPQHPVLKHPQCMFLPCQRAKVSVIHLNILILNKCVMREIVLNVSTWINDFYNCVCGTWSRCWKYVDYFYINDSRYCVVSQLLGNMNL
jgi:hypothetical protein